VISQGLTRAQSNEMYLKALEDNDEDALREFCLNDLFFLLTIGCKRKDINKDWLYDRCREVEADPDGYLDLWAREHYKSTIITFGLSIQNILNNPDITIGIFSHTRPIAKDFLKQIKTEFEQNTFLKSLFPDILYANPEKESPKWSLDAGIRVKRKTNPKEETVEAWGVVDGQPTGKHFLLLIYDDLVTIESVNTPDQIKKTTMSLQLSYNLGAQGGKRRFIGTRYHSNDTYKAIIQLGTVTPRIKPATDNGKVDGNSVFLPPEILAEKRRDFGSYVFVCQMLQDPVADNAMGFKEEWLRYYKKLDSTAGWNIYLIVDPANKKKKTSDYTVMEVIGLSPDQNYYLLDAVRDRMNLTERTAKLFELHRKWKPTKTGYEQYGMQSDIEHIEYVMEQENYRFSITEMGGTLAKSDRILKLVPIYEQHRFYMPESLFYIDYEKKRVDYIKSFLDEEYLVFPVSSHDDMMDCRARILDPSLGAKFPEIQAPVTEHQPVYYESGGGWMS
jgi:phage terminase large subunit-like protein